jgi:hypothetical protein
MYCILTRLCSFYTRELKDYLYSLIPTANILIVIDLARTEG